MHHCWWCLPFSGLCAFVEERVWFPFLIQPHLHFRAFIFWYYYLVLLLLHVKLFIDIFLCFKNSRNWDYRREIIKTVLRMFCDFQEPKVYWLNTWFAVGSASNSPFLRYCRVSWELKALMPLHYLPFSQVMIYPLLPYGFFSSLFWINK